MNKYKKIMICISYKVKIKALKERIKEEEENIHKIKTKVRELNGC